jgi:hypothetical protein
MMYRPHYVSLPEAAPTTSTALDDTPKPEEDASLTDATKESARQVTTAANTASIAAATSSATPVSTTGVGGAMGVASQQPISSGNMNPPQASGTIRPPPSTSIPSQAAQQGQFTLNQGMQHRPPNAMMMRQGAMGRGMMGGAGGVAAAGMQVPMNRMMAAQQQGGGMPAMTARLRLQQIRAQNLQQWQQIRAGGAQYPAAAAATGKMMGNHPPQNYRTPMMDPAAGGMPLGAPGGMMSTHELQQQMLLRHQQAQQRRIQMARIQQMQMQRRAAAMQQMAASGYPAGAAQGQQYTPTRPATGGMPPGAPGGILETDDEQQQMLLRHQQAQQRMQMARIQQIQMQRRAAAVQQMATSGYPAGAAQGQQYAMRPPPSPNSPMTMEQMMQGPQQAQYVQQSPRHGMMMPGISRPPGQPPMGYQTGINPVGAAAGTTAPPAPSVISTTIAPSPLQQRTDI